jgi:hypothetical protein
MPIVVTQTMRQSIDEVMTDLTVMMEAEAADAIIPIAYKYARLLVLVKELPQALMALQYHTTTPKAKEALQAALLILAQAKGSTLPEKPHHD